MSKSKRIAWNYGKRKPIVDEFGDKWCSCLIPKLTRPIDPNKGVAYCLLCKNHYYR